MFSAKSISAATWERLYSKKSTDCFRNVKEVSSGGYILAGYTANFAPSDTDALAIRLNTSGDTLWTLVYNGPSSKEDAFYKVLQTLDGGFIFCGYSKSFGSNENAFYVKTNSSGVIQWVKNWGGSGKELARDIVQLPNGKFVLCGYTTSAPANYYDVFILKIDQNGSTIWNKVYGGVGYDDANSLKLLPDGGFLVGGQSSNQLYLIRTDSDGNLIWSNSFGTTGIDNIKCLAFAQDDNGFILAGTTDGEGSGGEDGYLVKTDSGGTQLWAKTFGGNLNDGFHRIEQTSDGGYVACGTSSEGPWSNPNYWLLKLEVDGTMDWENFFGGDHHEHGYTGMQTSDGGYIMAGFSKGFSYINDEDGYIVKTNSSGQSPNKLSWTTVTELVSPVNATCGLANAQIKVEVVNNGAYSISSIPVTVEITGAITQTLTQSLNSTIDPEEKKILTFSTTVDMSGGGTFNFHCFTGNAHNVIPVQNYLDEEITVGQTTQPPSISNGSHCGPGVVSLSASSPEQINWFDASSGGSSLYTGSNFTTTYITSTDTYYAQAGQNCPSEMIPVFATITAGLTSPVGTNGSNCGTGTVLLSASSSHTVKWYATSTSTVILHSGSTFTTPVLSSSVNYYIAAENSTCSSQRVVVNAEIFSIPDDPVGVPGATCGNGTVLLTASANDPVKWYDVASGGSSIATGNSFTTPFLTTTTTFYALTDNGLCRSNRIPTVAVVYPVPVVNIGPDTIHAVLPPYLLDAGPGFVSYVWTPSGNSQTNNVILTGQYCVEVTNDNNCTATECTFVAFSVGINEVSEFNNFLIYPQPSNGWFTIEFSDSKFINYSDNYYLNVLDITGKSVFYKSISLKKETFDLTFLTKGVYILRIGNEKSSSAYRVMIN